MNHNHKGRETPLCDCSTTLFLRLIDRLMVYDPSFELNCISSSFLKNNLGTSIEEIKKKIKLASEGYVYNNNTNLFQKTISSEYEFSQIADINRIEFSVKFLEGKKTNLNSSRHENSTICSIKTMDEFPFYKMAKGWRHLSIEHLVWLPSRCAAELRFSLPADLPLSQATKCFYRALFSATNHYNTKLFSNILQFPSVNDYESQFFCYSSYVSEETLESKLKSIKLRHLKWTEDRIHEVTLEDFISVGIVIPPPDYTKKYLNDWIANNPIPPEILLFLPTNWMEIEDRTKQLIREKLHYYSALFINKHFDNLQPEEFQDMFLFGIENIPIQTAWFLLHHLDKYDLTDGKKFPEMFFLDHVERNWIVLIRIAQLFTAQCNYITFQLLEPQKNIGCKNNNVVKNNNVCKNSNVCKKSKKKKKQDQQLIVENDHLKEGLIKKNKQIEHSDLPDIFHHFVKYECLNCWKSEELELFPCGHSYLCQDCMKKESESWNIQVGSKVWKQKCVYCEL